MDTTNPVSQTSNEATVAGTLDGSTAGDHDQPYTFGRRPTVQAPAPFTQRQYARLLIRRSHQQTPGCQRTIDELDS